MIMRSIYMNKKKDYLDLDNMKLGKIMNTIVDLNIRIYMLYIYTVYTGYIYHMK